MTISIRTLFYFFFAKITDTSTVKMDDLRLFVPLVVQAMIVYFAFSVSIRKVIGITLFVFTG